jgi:hypothetical protein
LVPHVENKLAIGRAVVDAETGGDGRERTFPAALGRQRVVSVCALAAIGTVLTFGKRAASTTFWTCSTVSVWCVSDVLDVSLLDLHAG